MATETDIQSLSPSAIIDLFEVDGTSFGGNVFRWTNDVNELGTNIVWQSNTYTKYPVEAGGFEFNGTGKQPRPTIRLSNVYGLVGAEASTYQDMVGAKVTRRRTFIKYLDAVNFASGNPTADPNVALPDEIWYIDRKAAENGIFIEFELATSMDLNNRKLPKRDAVKNCVWQYRSGECSYSGGAVADINDNPTAVLANDVCSHRVSGCQLRFGYNAVLPFGGFPGLSK